MKNKNIKINYPNEQFPVILDGKNRYEDLKHLLFQGQGLYCGANLISALLQEIDTDFLKIILLGIIENIKESKRRMNESFVDCNDKCISPGEYFCINKKGKLVKATLKKNNKWNKNVILCLPYNNLIQGVDMLSDFNVKLEK